MSVESEFEYEKMQIAFMVKRLRAYASLSQRDLSNLTGISQADISKIERGLGNPSINTIARIMNATGTSLDFDYNRVILFHKRHSYLWFNHYVFYDSAVRVKFDGNSFRMCINRHSI